jgi:hypothetical protein
MGAGTLPRHRTAATLSLVRRTRPKLSTANPPTQAFSDDWRICVIAASLKSVWETSALPLTAYFLSVPSPKVIPIAILWLIALLA